MSKQSRKAALIVTDAEIEEAWGNANFGPIPKRDVIIGTLKLVAQAWGTGHTAMCIVKELGLVESRNNQIGLSDKGLEYLISYFFPAAQEHWQGWVSESFKWTNELVMEYAVRSHLPGNELTIEEFIKLKQPSLSSPPKTDK